MRLVFAGSPETAVSSLAAVAASGHELVGVVTREDSPHGRKRELRATPVAEAAAELGVPLIKANRLAGSATEAIAALQPDLGVIVAYGGLVREPLLSLPAHGWINLHFSLLPRWRGAAPVQHAIIAGDDLTGATVFRLVEELDAGDVYGQLTQQIAGHQTSGSLLAELADSGARLLVDVIDAIADGSASPQPQSGDVTLAPKLGIEDGRVDWSRTAREVDGRIRGVTPEPGAHTTIDGARLKILDAALAPTAAPLAPGRIRLVDGRVLAGTADQPIELLQVQPAGKTPMRAGDWWRGQRTEELVAQ